MKRLLRLFLLPVSLLILGLPAQVMGQEQSCSFTLKEAQRLYQQGLIKDIPAMLEGCLEKGFTRQQRQDAYKLIIQCLLYNDNQSGADSAMPRFMKKFPEYEINPTDPKEFVYLFNSYRNLPVLSIGASFGINWSQVSVIESYQIAYTNGTPRKYISGGFGTQFGLQVNTYIAPQIELGLGFLIANYTFSSSDSVKFTSASTQVIKAVETESRFEFPVFARYEFKPYKKFTPFVRLGIVPAYTNSTSLALSLSYVGQNGQNDLKAPAKDILGWRKQFGIWSLAGAGIKYDLPPWGYIWIDVKYQLGFTAMKLNTDPEFISTEIGTKYYYVSDNFKLSNFGISVGYSYSFYKPTKKQTKQ